jgi:acyl-CoA reductase-like NAD-dependent aldehyde dehydrogenase
LSGFRRRRGSFFEPTILTDVTTDMVITKEETFGSVAPLYRESGIEALQDQATFSAGCAQHRKERR